MSKALHLSKYSGSVSIASTVPKAFKEKRLQTGLLRFLNRMAAVSWLGTQAGTAGIAGRE